MPTFPDLTSLQSEVDGEALTLPVRGTAYTFSGRISIETGLRLTRIREEINLYAQALARGEQPDPDMEMLDDARETKMIRDLIGSDNLAAMQADGVTWPELKHIGETLLAWHLSGADAALTAWVGTGGDARPPAEADSSSSPPKKSRSGSTKTTSPRSKAATGRASAGRKSSTRGA